MLGARGRVGRRVVAEAIARGHEVTAVVRRADRLATLPGAARTCVAEATDSEDVAEACAGQDAVVNATRPPPGQEHAVGAITRGVLDGLSGSDARLLVVGGAASLRVPNQGGRRVLDDPRYLPAGARAVGQASALQLEICRADTRVDWVYLSPPADLRAGARTGAYRVGTDDLLVDDDGNSRISMEDLAVAVLDELERPRHRRRRFTVAY